MNISERTSQVHRLAADAGFSFCGISRSGFLQEEAPLLETWLKEKMHGDMHYMENHFDKRLDTTKLVEGSKSVITLLYNYYQPGLERKPGEPKISQYAAGEDYHRVVKDKMQEMVLAMQQSIGAFEARVFVDSAPVMDKAWARKSGAGWLGKNANLIHPKMGSFFFVAEIVCDVELEYDGPIKDYCGTCTACIDACPTEAIVQPYVVDGSKCISYFTIELKDAVIPTSYKNKFDNWMFGCDVCQDVCPWNRFSKPHNEPRFRLLLDEIQMSRNEWEELTEEKFNEVFRKSPLKRAGWKGIQRNLKFIG